jgi:hypothetical protein
MPRGTPRTTDAKNNPVIRSKTIETQEQVIGQANDRHFVGNQLSDNKVVLATENDLLDHDKLANLAFMDEKVTIRPATSTDPNAEQVFEITINGKSELFRRGEAKTVRRCFVDRMCMLKETVFDCKLVDKEGERQYIYPQTTGLKYDFSMLRDDNPKGADWLAFSLRMSA